MSFHTVPAMMRVWVCPDCGARQEQDSGNMVAPKCGQYSEDMHRFPDGGWMRVEQYSPHKDKLPTDEIIRNNPLQHLVDEKARLERNAAERGVAMRKAADELAADAERRRMMSVSELAAEEDAAIREELGVKTIKIDPAELDYSPENLLTEPGPTWSGRAQEAAAVVAAGERFRAQAEANVKARLQWENLTMGEFEHEVRIEMDNLSEMVTDGNG